MKLRKRLGAEFSSVNRIDYESRSSDLRKNESGFWCARVFLFARSLFRRVRSAKFLILRLCENKAETRAKRTETFAHTQYKRDGVFVFSVPTIGHRQRWRLSRTEGDHLAERVSVFLNFSRELVHRLRFMKFGRIR